MRTTNLSKRIALCAVVTIGLCGCATRIGDLTLASTKNIDLSNAHLTTNHGMRVIGRDCKWNVLGIPFGYPSLKDAIDRALEKGHANMMVDEVTRVRSVTFILADRYCYEVEGTVLNVSPKQ
jgi:hypothetical protein